MPQLSLKLPVFRRWGKKVFVAVDTELFYALPSIRPVESFVNSEITWLVYPFTRKEDQAPYMMCNPKILFSEWSDVEDALREGEPPKPDEILTDVQTQEKQDRAINILL